MQCLVAWHDLAVMMLVHQCSGPLAQSLEAVGGSPAEMTIISAEHIDTKPELFYIA